MEKLLNPDVGLMIWTVITFAVVVFVLGRFAWKPVLAALEAREERIRQDLKAAEDSRLASEKMKQDYERQMSEAEARTRELLSQTQKEAQRLRDETLKAAKEESARLAEKTRRELAEDQRRLVQELRSEAVGLSVKAAEKLLQRSVSADKALQEKILQDVLKDLEKEPNKGKA